VSGVFQNIGPPPPPLSTQRVCPPPSNRVHTRRALRGWGVNILEDARHWIGLLEYNLSSSETNLLIKGPVGETPALKTLQKAMLVAQNPVRVSSLVFLLVSDDVDPMAGPCVPN
jgi:hypothetical protein